jgi:serine/threonine protein phosphatase PrpC
VSLVIGAESHIGKRRARNEDRVFVWLSDDGTRLSSRQAVLAIADGMGGAAGGELASSLAVETLSKASQGVLEGDAGLELRRLFLEVNAAVHARAATSTRYQGMGTTLVVAIVQDGRLWVANVGDSRAYRLKGSTIQQITRDHSLVEEQVRAGLMTKERARSSSRRNLLTRCIGVAASVDVDVFGPEELSTGDTVLLCSDGLHSAVEDGEILEVVASHPPEIAARELVRLANEHGGRDNISVIVARWQPDE